MIANNNLAFRKAEEKNMKTKEEFQRELLDNFICK